MSKTKVKLARKLILMGTSVFSIVLFCTLGLGYFLQAEIAASYTYNYNMLIDAGFTDLVEAPKVISDRLMLIVTLIPLLGAGVVMPFLLWAAYEINKAVD